MYFGKVKPTETTSSVLRSTYTGNGSTTTYALPGPVANETSIIATINGVTQQDGAYSTDGSNIIFDAAPALNDAIELRTISAVGLSYAPYAGSVTTGILADDAVTTGKIVAGSVTSAKLASGAAVANIGARAITTAQVPVGSVIQVVSNISGLGSTSANAVLISLNITPSSNLSRILLLGTFEGERIGGNTGTYIFSYLRKGGSNLRTFMNAAGYQQTTGARNFNSIAYIDLPATTSSVNYDIYIDHTGAAASGITWNWYSSSFFALEIAA